jgi:serine/threonine protein kinase
MSKQLRRLHTLWRGVSGAVVWLTSDDTSGELLAVKSASAGAAETLRREGRLLAGLRSPHILPCLGSRATASGEHQLLLEFAPRGSLADEAARSGGRLAERAIRGHASDVARGLAYLHARALVHGDVKSRNVVVGADGRAKLADFGCARTRGCERPIGGTPAFMAPEVARGEEQGPAADVWALGCTVIEMATGRAPWGDVDDVFAAVHRIGFTDAVPELPGWLSPEANDFLGECLARNPCHRPTAAQLLEHPFVASADLDTETPAKQDWVVSPQEHAQSGFLGVGRRR